MALYELQEVPEHGGKGLFATKKIEKGTLIARTGSFAQFFSPDGAVIVKTPAEGKGLFCEKGILFDRRQRK